MTIPMPGSPECECATCEGCAEERHEGLMREGEPCPACHVHADPSYREEKRLKDAECAAEYWRAVANLLAAPPHSSEMLSAREKKRVCANFATHPHALEES